MLFTFPSRYWSAIGLSGVFSLTGWSRWIQTGFLVPRPTQELSPILSNLRVRDCHPLRFNFPVNSTSSLNIPMEILQPRPCRNTAGLGYSPFARHYLGNHYCFLFLRVLRCFSSPGSPPLRDDYPSGSRVAPFGNPRINSRLHLPVAFRSLPRPSSPPRAKASTLCPFAFS